VGKNKNKEDLVKVCSNQKWQWSHFNTLKETLKELSFQRSITLIIYYFLRDHFLDNTSEM